MKLPYAGGQSMSSNEIFKLAQENGINKHTLEKARKEVEVKCFPTFDEDGNKCWHWRLPDDKSKTTKIPGLQKLLDNLPKIPCSHPMQSNTKYHF